MTSKIVRLLLLAAFVVGLTATAIPASAAVLQFGYSGLPEPAVCADCVTGVGGKILFGGGVFYFSEEETALNNWAVDVSGDFPLLAGLEGKIIAPLGGWAIGAITIAGPTQSAPVSGVGTWLIDDGAGNIVSADLVWNTVETKGSGGDLNLLAIANLTNWSSYAGTNADIIKLLGTFEGTRTTTVSFNMLPTKTLTQLKAASADAPLDYAFAGAFSASDIPEPGTYALMGAGLAALTLLRRKKA